MIVFALVSFFSCELLAFLLLGWEVTVLFWNRRQALKLMGAAAVMGALGFGAAHFIFPPTSPRLLAEFSAQVKQVADPVELQKWAKLQPPTENSQISRDAVPSALRTLISQKTEMVAAIWDKDDERQPVVRLCWGGGFRRWGLTIGQPSYKVELDPENIYSEWKPGIYFWVEP